MGRVQANKSHKSRFSSKSSRNIHKTSLKDKSRIAKSGANVSKGARAARLQHNKMVREQKRAAVIKEKRASSGSTSTPRVIVLFGLSALVNVDSVAEDLLKLLSAGETTPASSTVSSPEYRLRATVMKAPHGDLVSCMEMAKVADLIAFVASASSLCEDSGSYYIDSFGNQCLSVFRSLGLPSTVVFIRDLPSEMKTRNELKKMCMSSLTPEFPEDCKFYPADTKDELHKFMWLFREQRLTVPHWRNQRPYLVAHKFESRDDLVNSRKSKETGSALQVDMAPDSQNPGKGALYLTGYVRARNLSVNQLVHISGVGDFQLGRIDVLKDPFPLNAKKDHNAMDSDGNHDVEVTRSLYPDPMKQEVLLVENVPDPLAGEQTWPTEEEMAEAERSQKQKKLRKKILPRGTSEYQAAWILDGSDEEDLASDDEEDDDSMVLDEGESGLTSQEGMKDFEDDDQASLNLRDSDEETDADSVMMDANNLTKEQIKEEIQKIKEAHAEDEEYPDEVETPLDIPARKRFARYRGLKSFRTSSWDPKESLPPEYARIFAFDNFKRTQKHVFGKALNMEQAQEECVPTGSYARLEIKEVPVDVASKLSSIIKTSSVVACGLFQHESKMSVLHFSIKKHDSYDAPIKAKEELIFHMGFRQFVARPIFSTDNMNSDKHKMERFLHAGRFNVASMYAPICFPPLPLIALKEVERGSPPCVAAVGSLRSVDPDRIILKKIILTGYPQRVSKRKASVRYMFHNPEDVRWFKPVEVWTKAGRRGRIKEPVGTHGAMKCILNGVLQQNDTLCLSLYKRVYPKWPEHRFPLLDASR